RQASENSLIKEHLCPSGYKPLADQLLEMNLFTTKTLLLSLFITLHFSTAACGQENDQPMKPEDTEWYEPVPLVITPGGGTFLAHSGPLHAPRSEPWPPVFSPAALGGAPTPPVVTRLHCRLGRPAGQQPTARRPPRKAGLRADRHTPSSSPFAWRH